MADFLNENAFVSPDKRVLVLPIECRPDKVVLHSRHFPNNPLEPLAICRVMPNGEVFKGKDGTLEDVATILIRDYSVSFKQLAEMWALEDAGHEPDEG